MPDGPPLFAYVGQQIRDLRDHYDQGKGISQEVLAKALKTTANTISRWETATYKPTLDDLERLARFFGVSILHFFPDEEPSASEQVNALLRTAKQLRPDDLQELQNFAEFRRARHLLKGARPRPGRKMKKAS